MITSAPSTQTLCYHCGNDCASYTNPLVYNDKPFCCTGCQTVYQILSENGLCQYYDLNNAPGKAMADAPQLERLAYLEVPDIVAQLVDFQNETVAHITFYVPAIHCSSCLWLLEHLYRIEPAIQQTRVDFLKKQVHVVFNPAPITLRRVVELLTSLGYEPLISLNDVVKSSEKPTYRPLLYRLAVAGFCSGNIMLFSFPEYLGLDDPAFTHLFGILNLLLATPVVFYSGSGYFASVWKSLRRGMINIDFPILLGILVAYLRGTYEVLALNGAGYYDSVSGLIFFLLCGKWFQQRTYDFLSFERDYKSYFPLAATQLIDTSEKQVSLSDLRKGNRIRVRHGDLIPADGLLYRGEGLIDYSFVTGESEPERKEPGALLYAGGRQMGGSIDLELVREVSQSYLTQLWNNSTFTKESHLPNRTRTFADAVGTYFTATVLTLATLIGAYWFVWMGQPNTAVNAFTAVLIVACPCVLSLSYPVALGHGLRWFGKQGFYLKNAEVIEQLTHCDTIVFDKTGTLTIPTSEAITKCFNHPLAPTECSMIRALVSQSSHPLSRKIGQFLADSPPMLVENFTELPGQGIVGLVDDEIVKVGSAAFVGGTGRPNSTTVHVSIDGTYRGYFCFAGQLREGLPDVLAELSRSGKRLMLLSGDNDTGRTEYRKWFADEAMHFGCSPEDKLRFIEQQQANGHQILMIGDGLNDAGALKQADVGLAVTDDTLHFTPASDAILESRSLRQLPRFLGYSRYAMRLIRFSFAVSLLYNFVGLSFAATGHLSPVVAAVLMPLSSITMVVIATVGMRWKNH